MRCSCTSNAPCPCPCRSAQYLTLPLPPPVLVHSPNPNPILRPSLNLLSADLSISVCVQLVPLCLRLRRQHLWVHRAPLLLGIPGVLLEKLGTARLLVIIIWFRSLSGASYVWALWGGMGWCKMAWDGVRWCAMLCYSVGWCGVMCHDVRSCATACDRDASGESLCSWMKIRETEHKG